MSNSVVTADAFNFTPVTTVNVHMFPWVNHLHLLLQTRQHAIKRAMLRGTVTRVQEREATCSTSSFRETHELELRKGL